MTGRRQMGLAEDARWRIVPWQKPYRKEVIKMQDVNLLMTLLSAGAFWAVAFTVNRLLKEAAKQKVFNKRRTKFAGRYRLRSAA